MTLDPRIWSLERVKDLAERTAALYEKVLVTTEYTTGGNSFRKQKADEYHAILDACSEYLDLYGDDADRRPDQSQTSPFLIR